MYIILISFINGLYNLVNLAYFYYQKDDLLITSGEIQFMAGILTLPWCLKPLFGFIFDHLIRKYKKTKYIIMICSMVRITLYYIMSMYRLHAFSFYAFLIMINIAAVFENITCEYILVVSSK